MITKEKSKQSIGKLVPNQNLEKSWRNSEGPHSLGSKAQKITDKQQGTKKIISHHPVK